VEAGRQAAAAAAAAAADDDDERTTPYTVVAGESRSCSCEKLIDIIFEY
jgi:hypothetical protein